MTKRKTPREFSYSFKLQVLIDYYLLLSGKTFSNKIN